MTHGETTTGVPPVTAPSPFAARLAVGAVAVVLVAGLVLGGFGLHRWNNPNAPSGDGPPQTLTGLAKPGPVCRLKIVDSGASVDTNTDTVHYAIVVTNPCHDVAVSATIQVYPVGADGSRLGRGSLMGNRDTAQVLALGPGRRTAVAGSIVADDALDPASVTGVRASTSAQWTSQAGLRESGEWGRRVSRLMAARPRVRDIHAARGHHGDALVTLTVRTEDPVREVSDLAVTVVFRDRSGRLLCGGEDSWVALNKPLVRGDGSYKYPQDRQSVLAWAPPRADLSATEAYWMPPRP